MWTLNKVTFVHYTYTYMSWILFKSLKIRIVAWETSIKKSLILYGPFLWMEFNSFNATEQLPGDSLLFIKITKLQILNCLIDFTTPKWYSMALPYSKCQMFSSPQLLQAGVFLACNLIWFLEVVSATFLLVYFLSLKESISQTRKILLQKLFSLWRK